MKSQKNESETDLRQTMFSEMCSHVITINCLDQFGFTRTQINHEFCSKGCVWGFENLSRGRL